MIPNDEATKSSPVILVDAATLRAIVREEVERSVQPLHDARAPMLGATTIHARDDAPDLLTRQQVAQRLQLDLRTLRRAELAGDVPAALRLGQKIVRWRRRDIDDFVRDGHVNSNSKTLSMRRSRG